MNDVDRRSIDEANRLYWDSSSSVADIAEQLGWSRRALYDAIEPLPTDTPCTVCGTPLVFLNRSARVSGTTTCVACTTREEEATAQEDRELRHAYAAEARDRRERIYAAGAAGLLSATVAAGLTLLFVRRR